MTDLTPEQILAAIDEALERVSRHFARGGSEVETVWGQRLRTGEHPGDRGAEAMSDVKKRKA